MTDLVVRGLSIDLETLFQAGQPVREPIGASADLGPHPGRHDVKRLQRCALIQRAQFTVAGPPARSARTT